MQSGTAGLGPHSGLRWTCSLRRGIGRGHARGHVHSGVGLDVVLRVGMFTQAWDWTWACAWACPLRRWVDLDVSMRVVFHLVNGPELLKVC